MRAKAETITAPFVALALFALLLAWPVGVDFRETFYPATRALVAGHNPYAAARMFANPAYALVPLVPVALGLHIGAAIMRLFALTALAYTARRMGAGVVAVVLFLTLPTTVMGLWANNVDWLALLGSVQHTALAVPLLLVKPQIGAALVAFLLVQALRHRGMFGLRAFVPAAVLLTLSVALYGTPDAHALTYPRTSSWNMAAFWWPRSMVLGAALLAAALATGRKRLALLAGPYFAPYVSWASWGAVLVVFVNRWWVMLVIWVTMWVWVFSHM